MKSFKILLKLIQRERDYIKDYNKPIPLESPHFERMNDYKEIEDLLKEKRLESEGK